MAEEEQVGKEKRKASYTARLIRGVETGKLQISRERERV